MNNGVEARIIPNPNELSLSGSKRSHGNAFKAAQNQDYDDQDPPFTVPGNSIKNLKK